MERELIGGVREWIRWTEDVMDSESVEKLNGTGGRGNGSIAKCNLNLELCFRHRNKGIDCGRTDKGGLSILAGERMEMEVQVLQHWQRRLRD